MNSLRYADSSTLLSLEAGPAAGQLESPYVKELTFNNFNDNVHPVNQYTIINVFAPWLANLFVFEEKKFTKHMKCKAKEFFAYQSIDDYYAFVFCFLSTCPSTRCPVSQAFEPMYNGVAEKLAVRADLTFAKVNADDDVDLRRVFKIDSYPTIFVVK
jgi:thiol-disulfide isomerase/thioredoxin